MRRNSSASPLPGGWAAGFGAGELWIATIDDDIAEDDGSITAAVAKGIGYEVGSDSISTVIVTDSEDREARRSVVAASNQAVFSELADSIGVKSLDTATQRVTSVFSRSNGVEFELGGKSTMQDFIRTGGDLINSGKKDPWQKVLGETSFEFGLSPEEGVANSATVWEYGDFRDMSASGDGTGKLDGEIFTGHLGFDTLIGDGMVAGLAASISNGDLDYGIAKDKTLSYTTTATGLHPYFGLETSDGSRFQVIAGYGLGRAGLD